MPCCDRSHHFNLGSFNSVTAINIRLWIIPYTTVDVNGYDIGEVDLPELRDMESTFRDINASRSNLSEEESLSSANEHT